MRELFLKVLAFFLGIKHKSPEELRIGGEKLIKNMIFESLRPIIPRDSIESVWLIGAIEYSNDKLNEIKSLLHQGIKYEFKIPLNFNFEQDYIDFYQVATNDNRYFICAFSNTYALSNEDKQLMLVQISDPYPSDQRLQ